MSNDANKQSDKESVILWASTINGWYCVDELGFLYDLALQCRCLGTTVELGSYLGRSTVVLCCACGALDLANAMSAPPVGDGDPRFTSFRATLSQVRHVISIGYHLSLAKDLGKSLAGVPVQDSWTGINDLCKECPNLICVLGNSSEMARYFEDGIALLHVDAGHDYESLRKDMEAWWPKLLPCGVVAFHDYDDKKKRPNIEVHTFVRDMLAGTPGVDIEGRVGTLIALRKTRHSAFALHPAANDSNIR